MTRGSLIVTAAAALALAAPAVASAGTGRLYCGSQRGEYVTARNITVTRGVQCQWGKHLFLNWEIGQSQIHTSRIQGWTCRSRVSTSIYTTCTAGRHTVRWRVPIEGQN